ncbi:hypothetical protein CEUSTIGMA_g12826.t1 [Chlamydomonas eustigma]|uniref:Uncharacterized protein n=1 Tax=Chlamydomonas eustigma TaxID=1157962 RepID=A0A250XRH5_9CHLO|nr:hypothetical protein CEUSTIGMA_g12826.t1 [Chlamydomonas eustigma]|eukprot:GAX85410.1 hypothetical protein CEUSTIGMA_g12826.t1 [Chlamydomonas eustigma]
MMLCLCLQDINRDKSIKAVMKRQYLRRLVWLCSPVDRCLVNDSLLNTTTYLSKCMYATSSRIPSNLISHISKNDEASRFGDINVFLAARNTYGIDCQQVRGMACSAGLGRAPPKVINIEFDPKDVEAFIAVADAIEAAFPKVIVNGNEEEDGRPGSFEVSTEDGVNIFSRISTGLSPKAQDIIEKIVNRAKLTEGDEDLTNKPFCG